jgi:hypothetical protein
MITLKTLPQATAQQVFDQVVQHMLRQGKPAISDSGACCYRYDTDDKILKCAAGCLISDNEYRKYFDDAYNSSWSSLVDEGLVPDTHFTLITELQHIHDKSLPEYWEKDLQILAFQHGLQYNPLPSGYIPDGTQLSLF